MIPKLYICLVATIIVCLAACAPVTVRTPAPAPATAAILAPTTAPTRLETLRFDVTDKPDIPDLPRVLAVETLREMGYTVETFQFDDNFLAVQAVEQGDLDAANVSNGIAWAAIQKGAKLATILDDISEARVLLAGPEIQSCADLDGKQVAVSSTTSTQALMVNQYLEKNCPGTKIDPLVISGSSNRVAALLSGQLAATPVDFANYLALQRQGNTNIHALAFFSQEFPGLRGAGLVVPRDLIDKHPETARDIIRAILEARRKLDDPTFLRDAIVKYVGLDPQEAQQAATAYLEHQVWDLNGGWTPENLQFNLDFFETAGGIEEGLRPEDVADLEPLNAVLDEIGRK